MIKYIIISLLTGLLISCTSKKEEGRSGGSEDTKAKEMLQGIWTDDDNNPLLRIIGDTMYNVDPRNAPVYFKIIKDSLYTYGNRITQYQIDRQTEYTFWFHSLSDEIIKLSKSENEEDSLIFSGKRHEIIPIYTEVTQKDSIVNYNNIRYRAYVYINPSTKKVIKTSYSGDGINVDNSYFDNVIHICVYEGKKSIYAKDITKQMFEGIIPADFLSGAILSDMQFIGVEQSGFQYQANVCIPESYVCNLVNLTVSFDGQLTIAAVE